MFTEIIEIRNELQSIRKEIGLLPSMTEFTLMKASFQRFAMQEDLIKLKEVVDQKADAHSLGSAE